MTMHDQSDRGHSLRGSASEAFPTQLRIDTPLANHALRNPTYAKAVQASVSYLLRSGLNQPDAITLATEVVSRAAEQSISGSARQAAIPLDRLALEKAIDLRTEHLQSRRIVVPAEQIRPMTKAAPNRLINPFRRNPGQNIPAQGGRAVFKSLSCKRSLHSRFGRIERQRAEGSELESSPRLGSTLVEKKNEVRPHDLQDTKVS